MVRKSIKIRYQDMLKIRKFIRYLVIDAIDEGSANVEYIKLLREMKISNMIEKQSNKFPKMEEKQI
jgi:hypothetical protein